MHISFHHLFQKLEKQRQEYVRLAKEFPNEALQIAPRADSWSTAQVLYHLEQVDAQVLKSIEKSLTIVQKLPSASLKTNFRSLLLNVFLRLPLKFKAPPVLGNMPSHVDLEEVLNSWETSRSRLKDLLDQFPPELMHKSMFRHPISGMLTMRQTLTFLHAHAAHHSKQFKATLPTV
ncbi:DinB family protein [Rufibacter roseus]|uniref:DinB family protein n=1 Tax=Rufibacter roseus TaxID=1567108 RepID=A0ABW2DNI2_9BACT|nr:DinB family protein [Rufibacter roseus]